MAQTINLKAVQSTQNSSYVISERPLRPCIESFLIYLNKSIDNLLIVCNNSTIDCFKYFKKAVIMAHGGKRQGAGRTKTAIVTAVRLDIRCPYCDTGQLNDVLSVKGQRLTCSECGRDSVIPTSANIRVSNEDYPTLTLGSIKQSSLFAEPEPSIEKTETIKLDWQLTREVLKRLDSTKIIRNMRKNQYNYNPDHAYWGSNLRAKADLIEIAERVVSDNPDDYQRIIYKAKLKNL